MNKQEARAALNELNMAIGVAAMVIRPQKVTLDRFFEEKRSMDAIGPILDPTLFNSSERRATEALLLPVYRAALDFLAAYDDQVAKTVDALSKVRDDA